MRNIAFFGIVKVIEQSFRLRPDCPLLHLRLCPNTTATRHLHLSPSIMPTLPFVTLDVFTRTRYQGNPLAVVTIPVGRDVATETMQTIAREFNLSETIFVHEGVDGEDGVREWRVRIFLVRGEVPFAGE